MGKTEWSPNSPKQREALCRSENEILTGGARGGGKTELGIVWLGDPAYTKHPEFSSLVLRENAEDLDQWCLRAKRMFGDMISIAGKPKVITWPAGGKTYINHWKDKNTISKYIGQEYWKILLEEITQTISSEDEYRLLLGSLRIPAGFDLAPQVMCSTNPGGKGHRFVKEYFVEKAKNKTYIDPDTGYSRIFIPFKSTDNPDLPDTYKSWLNGLSDGIREAWRDGSWEHFEGKYFGCFGLHCAVKSHDIEVSQLRGRLIGSLDGGTMHNTSFGLWWITPDFHAVRLFTYCENGGTHATHAQEIFDRVESFLPTKGMFPDIIVYDYAMDTKSQNNEWQLRSPIDEYKDIFFSRKKSTVFEPANKNKQNGCQVMKEMFTKINGDSIFKYWPEYNKDFVDAINAAPIDKNGRDMYAKFPGDDPVDEARYGMIKIYTMISHLRQYKEDHREKTMMEKLFYEYADSNNSTDGKDWYTM